MGLLFSISHGRLHSSIYTLVPHNDFAATIGGWHGEQQNLARLIKLPIHNRVSSDQYFFLVAP
jgi:hypothetical protein